MNVKLEWHFLKEGPKRDDHLDRWLTLNHAMTDDEVSTLRTHFVGTNDKGRWCKPQILQTLRIDQIASLDM